VWLDRQRGYGSDPFAAGSHYQDVVVGGGLTGLVTAVLLAEAGRTVVLLEARRLGAVTTGNTSGKVSLLQGTQLSRILKKNSREVTRAYLDANRDGQAWLLRYCEDHDVPLQHRDAFTYAGTPDGRSLIIDEFEACQRLGLDVSYLSDLDLPYQTYGALTLPDQVQFDPLDLLEVLAGDFKALSGTLHEGVRVVDVQPGSPHQVSTSVGSVSGDNVVLATGTPILDRGLYFAKLTPVRSYGLAFCVSGSLPRGMYLSADSPTRSLRTAPHEDDQLLIVGGNPHVVGRHASPRQLVDELTAWTCQHFPDAELTHSWSAQDYASHNEIPFVGLLRAGKEGGKADGGVYVSTGYNKWGMTNAVAGSLRISAEILGNRLDWADVLGRRLTHPSSVAKGVQANVAAGVAAVRGWASSEMKKVSDEEAPPDEGQGFVRNQSLRPVAISTVNGTTCTLSAVCSHLGGVVSWNDAELSWDCPLHGSRFAADGTLLEGPATQGLDRLDD
jgi:glycine/D-amino acid oxidase-like deaminating enzyme/nitrite reductase/ring-hydroxylating ferredoxin subunit